MMFASLSRHHQDLWHKMLEKLDVDPTVRAMPFIVAGLAKNIEQLRHEFTGTTLKSPPRDPRDAVPDHPVDRLSDGQLREAVIRDVNGMAPIADSILRAALSRRAAPFPYLAYVADDIVVTAEKPLIINSSTAVTAFGVVTIRSGGYIKIQVPCHFQCVTLVKEAGLGPGAGHDFMIVGADGADGEDGADGPDGKNGEKGNDAKATCDSLIDGGPGGGGGPGGPGAGGAPGHDGAPGPTIVISINDLQSTISVLNQGGAGGRGGYGGNGGRGGDGGKGGNADNCGGRWAQGGSGGDGGPGGDGGNGGPGGNGGEGGTSVINFSARNGIEVLVTNGQAPFGQGGRGGDVGRGGKGGEGGGVGASPGKSGNPGTKPGADGPLGNRGSQGTVRLNPQ